MIPIEVVEDFIICFEAEEETMSKKDHFMKECGWTYQQYRGIKNHAWFSAKVSAWKDGKELGAAYLGACCYKTEEEFYTTYKNDYYKQLVQEAIAEAKQK